jgi:hypothetical protein
MAKSKGKAKGKATVQSSLAIPAYPHLKKPLDHLGKQITVPGSAWGGRVAPDELHKLYKCTVQDFTLAHKFEEGWGATTEQARMHPHRRRVDCQTLLVRQNLKMHACAQCKCIFWFKPRGRSAAKLENACICSLP